MSERSGEFSPVNLRGVRLRRPSRHHDLAAVIDFDMGIGFG
jgi:hypothetical protein